MRRCRRCGNALPTGGDAGASLVEVLVSLGLTSVVMIIFTTGMLTAYRATNLNESVSIAQSQLQMAFQRLDNEIRYATWIAEPSAAPVRGSWYVEFAGLNAVTRQPECKQLRLKTATGILQYLRWTPGSPPAEGATGETLASDLVADAVTRPFYRQAAGSYPYATPSPGTSVSPAGASFAPDFDRLRLRITTRVATSTTDSDVAFTALNTSRDTPSTNVCQEGRPL